MQADIPRDSVAAINAVHALAHEREYLRSAAIDLMRAGLPCDAAADICVLARTRRRECRSMKYCTDGRSMLNAEIRRETLFVLICAGTECLVRLDISPCICVLRGFGWQIRHDGSLACMPESMRETTLKMLEAAENFSTCETLTHLVNAIADYIRGTCESLPAQWSELAEYVFYTVVASISDAEVVIKGRSECEKCGRM